MGGGDKRACSFAPHREPVCVPTACFVLHWTARVDGGAAWPFAPNQGKQTMKGHTHISVTLDRTIAHLDPHSDTHARDRLLARKLLAAVKALDEVRIDLRPSQQAKFATLDGGILVARNGRQLSAQEHKASLQIAVKERGYYWAEETRGDGRHRLRKKKTKGVHSLAITFRPDVAQALAALERSPKFRHLIRPFVMAAVQAAVAEFEAATGLEVLVAQVHPEESVLHFHLTYASVSAAGELLWRRGHRGRHGLRLLGPSHIGILRLIEAGFLPAEDGQMARVDLDRMSRKNGEEPADWRLSLALDGAAQAFAESHCVQSVFAEAAAEYSRDLQARRAQRPEQLRSAKNEVVEERDRLAAEVAALKTEVARLTAAPPVFVPTISQPQFAPGLLPPLPPIFLTRTGPSGPRR